MGDVGRLFVAVPVPTEVRAALVATLDRIDLPGKPVVPANWHLTLAFLGVADQVRFERLLAELDQLVLPPAFGVVLAGLGAFPTPRRATVLWVGLTRGEGRLRELAGAVGEGAEAAGFEPGERPYHPHLTISRVRPDVDARSLLDTPVGPFRLTVDHLAVFRSHLGGPVARYEVMERFPLR